MATFLLYQLFTQFKYGKLEKQPKVHPLGKFDQIVKVVVVYFSREPRFQGRVVPS